MSVIGTASWSIPRELQHKFPSAKNKLQSYSQVFKGVEINSTFYNFHRLETFEKWYALTPHDFQFCLKLHREFSHQRFVYNDQSLARFFDEARGLKDKFKVLLIQFPPKQEFNLDACQKLIDNIRLHYSGFIVVEPRHSSWTHKEAKTFFKANQLSKVVADPERCSLPSAYENAGGITYYRLHGSPVIYRSSYDPQVLEILSEILKDNDWCIFDNTASGHGTANALDLNSMLRQALCKN